MVEPLGEDFWLEPEDTFMVTYTSHDVDDPQFSVAVMTDYVIVWINAGDPDAFTVHNETTGAQVECGHNRPDGWGSTAR